MEESPGGRVNRPGCGVRQHEFSPEGYSAMNRALSRDRACAVSPSHFRYRCVCVCVSHSVVSNFFATPWTVDHQTSLSLGFPRREYRSMLPFPSAGDPPNPGIKPVSPAWQVYSLLLSHLGSPCISIHTWISKQTFVCKKNANRSNRIIVL